MTDSTPDASLNEGNLLQEDVFRTGITELNLKEVSEEARFYFLQILCEAQDRLEEVTDLVRQRNLQAAETHLESLCIDLSREKCELGAILLRPVNG